MGVASATEWLGLEQTEKRHHANSGQVKLFCSNTNRPLAEAVARALRIPLGMTTVERFPDGEVRVRLLESIRGDDVYLLQPTAPRSTII